MGQAEELVQLGMGLKLDAGKARDDNEVRIMKILLEGGGSFGAVWASSPPPSICHCSYHPIDSPVHDRLWCT
jgi:hypothetical protein